jgi:TM2 domain-containing membrane protein YozV
MIVVFLLLVILAMALGIVGAVVKGLLYLLFTGIGVLLVAFLLGALWMRRRTARRRHAQ